MRKKKFTVKVKPLVLVVLDGWGFTRKKYGNAIVLAHTPTMFRLWKECSQTILKASGKDVGLPEGVMGSSEVGHLNLGAGRIVLQDLLRINKAIKESAFSRNSLFQKAFENALVHNSNLHLMGLLSTGGVHSHINHLFALLKLAKRHNIKVCIHAFLDGRDALPISALKYLDALEAKIDQLKTGKIATVMGRYYSMDRDTRWDRTAKAYYAIVLGRGIKASSAKEAIERAYVRGETDEFVQPTVIEASNEPFPGIKNHDSVIFFNFRSDRPRQLVKSIVSKSFGFFDRERVPKVYFVCMTEYNTRFKLPVAFPPVPIKNSIGEVISKAGLRQLRIAETEKHPHVTFFFNGGLEKAFANEDRILIPSPRVATYDLKPEMSAFEVTGNLVDKIISNQYDFILANYANPDMVAHTGNLSATVEAIEAVDKCLAYVVDAVKSMNGICVVTSDHGHAEEMLDRHTGKPRTAHTLNPVPFFVVFPKVYTLRTGRLADVAPTVLHILGFRKPVEMTGTTLITSD